MEFDLHQGLLNASSFLWVGCEMFNTEVGLEKKGKIESYQVKAKPEANGLTKAKGLENTQDIKF